MARIPIEETTDFYDDELDVVIDKYGDICSSVPTTAFAFGDKLYTYGTIVHIHFYRKDCDAEFKEEDGVAVFQPLDGSSSIHFSYYTWGDNMHVIEIKKAVLFQRPTITREDPPDAVGYKTVCYRDPKNPANTTYHDHLYGCVVDGAGNIVHSVQGNNFGFKKRVYAPGTCVVVKAHAGDKRCNSKLSSAKNDTEKKYIYYTAYWDGTYYRFYGTMLPRDKEVRKSNWYGQPEKIGSLGGMTIVYISQPHYFRSEVRETTAWERFKLNGGNPPPDTSVGTIWYIVIMAVATIFKARIGIWIVATIIFLLWKFGYMNKK